MFKKQDIYMVILKFLKTSFFSFFEKTIERKPKIE